MILNIGNGMSRVPKLDNNYPSDVSVISGNNATFKVVVTDAGVPKENTFQWFVNGTAISGATTSSYTRNTSSDKGVMSVWCEVTNKSGTTISRKASLTVSKVPVLHSSYPANASVSVTDTVTFSVAISDHGYPTNYSYQWYVNGSAISGATSSSYTSMATPSGTRNVYCIVSNGAGSVQSRVATLSVGAKYYYSYGTFHYGGSYDWVSDSDTLKDCGITNGSWYLQVDGGGHFGATWGTAVANLTGISTVIFTVSTTYTSGHDNSAENIEEDIGWGRMGVVDTSNLGNTYFTAGTSVRMLNNSTARDFAVDVSHLSGNYAIKFVVDRTAQRDNGDTLYISAIRFE